MITIPYVQMTFKSKRHFTRDSYNFIYVVTCDTCIGKFIENTGEGETKLRDRVGFYRQYIWQPKTNKLKPKGSKRKG